MSTKRLNTQEFILRSNLKHGNLYIYPNAFYENGKSIIRIECKIHGEFKQKANSHLNGAGCPKCGIIRNQNSRKLDISYIISKASEVHNHKYDYSKVIYINNRSKVTIICPIHGEFQQTISSHIRGTNCSKCSDLITKSKNLTSLEIFTRKASLSHNSKYDYSKVSYERLHDKIEIICPIHGSFFQKANDHIRGIGCRMCSIDKLGWSFTNWKNSGEKSRYFESFKVYIIKCINSLTKEEFYKIGKTYKTLEARFSGKQFPYEYEVIKVYIGDAYEMSKLEISLKNKNNSYRYTPKIKFGGSKECFTNIIL